MVQAVERQAYRDQLHAFLPTGAAWPDEPGTVLDGLVEAIAAQMAEIDLDGAALLDEIRPNTTFDLLSDWERVVGLPDKCSVLGATVTVRRASLLEKLVTKPTLSASEFIRIGRTFGVDITIEEHDQTRAEAWAAAQTPPADVGGGKWRYVWWITIPTSADVIRFTTVSTFDTPFRSVGRNTEMECRLQNAAPAHTVLVIEYNAVPQFGALNDVSLARGGTHVLPAASGGDTPITYSVAGLPTGVTFTAGTRTLAAAADAALGTVELTYMVEDDDGDEDSGTVSLTVTA